MVVFLAWALPYLLSLATVTSMILAGNKRREAWALGLATQAVWLLWAWCAGQWGFLPLTAAITVIYWRNWRKWRPA